MKSSDLRAWDVFLVIAQLELYCKNVDKTLAFNGSSRLNLQVKTLF